MEERIYDIKFANAMLDIAEGLAQLSKCVSFSIGAVIVKNGRIISSGVNGSPSKFINCNEKFNAEDFSREEHHKFSEKYEIHAELNAILNAAKEGISIDGADMYVNYHPCYNCLKNLAGSGIKRVFYRHEYDKFVYDKEFFKNLEKNGLRLINIGREET